MTTTPANQIENLETNLPDPAPVDSASPRMPFKTAYVLTREQEDALMEHAALRVDQIEQQLGKRSTFSGEGVPKEFRIESEPDSFFGKRERFTARYYNHVEDRKKAGVTPFSQEDTLYNHSNLTASLSQRITAQMVAKSASYFFGAPDDNEWFTAEGIGLEDAVLADKVKKFARHKVKACQIKQRHVQALEFAWVRGESVIKTTHQERFQVYKRTASVMVDEAGEPILDAYGDYILEADAWIPEVATQPRAPIEGEPEAETGEPVMEQIETGNLVLKRDGVTVKPAAPVFVSQVITRRLVTFRGPDSRLCYFKDIIIPLDAPSVQEADLMSHVYDLPVMEVAQMFSGQFAEGDDGVRDFTAAVELLREMLSTSSLPKSELGQPRADMQEISTERSPNDPSVQVAECWLRYDADGDGIQEEILLFFDRATKAPIFYEYAANVTVRGLRPFDVIRPIEVDGRWYGMGAMEYFDPEQEFIDLQINRKNFRDGGSGRVTFWAPWMTKEGQANPNLQLNHGKTYTLVENAKAEEALTYVQLPDNTGELMELLELFMQFMQIKSGVLTGADRNISNMPSSETLGEENLITEAGDELFSMFLLRLYVGLSGALATVIDTIFANLDRKEVFTYFNGDAQEVLELTPEEVKDLALNVRFSITRSRDKQLIEAGQSADNVIAGFYSQPLLLQQRMAGYSRARLKALRVPQPDEIIEPTDPALYMPPAPEATAVQ